MSTLQREPVPVSPVTTLAAAVELRTITFPVAGETRYADTFGACRDGCSRSHKGVDIFAPKLTPLVAVADGTVVRERRNSETISGNSITIEDDDGWRYIYVHLNNDTPGTDDDANPQSWVIASGLRAGDRVRAGQLIGYLGDSGNAETTEPHLHFEIRPPGGTAINPTPSVSAADEGGSIITIADLAASVAEESEWEEVVEEWYVRMLGRLPDDDELRLWAGRLGAGQGEEADLVADLALSAPYRQPEGTGIRLHLVLFGTLPDDDLLDELADLGRDGAPDDEVAATLLQTPEARERLVDDEIDDVMAATLDRLGIDATVARRGDPAAALADTAGSSIVLNQTWPLVLTSLAYRHGAGRMPDTEELNAWVAHLDQGGLLADVVAGALAEELPDGPAGVAGVDSGALGYEPGASVRQGPVLLDPASEVGEGSGGSLVGGGSGDATVDYDLRVDGDEDGDTATLKVRIPLDELAAADGTVELNVELNLTRPVDPDEDPAADAAVDVVIDQPTRAREREREDRVTVRNDDEDVRSTPTTRPRTATTTPRRTAPSSAPPAAERPTAVRPRVTPAPTSTAPPPRPAPTATVPASAPTSTTTASGDPTSIQPTTTQPTTTQPTTTGDGSTTTVGSETTTTTSGSSTTDGGLTTTTTTSDRSTTSDGSTTTAIATTTTGASSTTTAGPADTEQPEPVDGAGENGAGENEPARGVVATSLVPLWAPEVDRRFEDDEPEPST